MYLQIFLDSDYYILVCGGGDLAINYLIEEMTPGTF